MSDLRRTIVTPEGVPVNFMLAQAGDRAAAFVIDALLMLAVVAVFYVLIGLAGGSSSATPFLLVIAFLVQNFYFLFFEVRWQGSTPGKRALGIRVIDARGGPLGAGAVLARNLVRDVEVWVPLQLIVAGEQVWPDAPGWARLVATAWTLLFMLMPLFNKDRMRIGNLVGGTRVVRAPKTVLLPDLAAEPIVVRRDAVTYSFTEAQLAVYGIRELQVLEGVLRAEPSPSQEMQIHAVFEKITEKIRWVAPPGVRVDREQVLRDFYAALRAMLERKALLGHRKADKFG